MSLRRQLLPCTLLLATTAALAQTAQTEARAASAAASPATSAAASPGKAGETYAGEAVVVERLDTAYRYNADGTGTKLDTDVVRLQSDTAVRNFGVVSIPYASGTQRLEVVYLRVRKPDGTVIVTPAHDAQDQPAPVTQAAPFYSDLHLLQIPVRGLAVGDRVEYQVRTVLTAPEVQNQFWGAEGFGMGVVVLQRTVELRVPVSKYVGVSSPKFPPETRTEGDEKVYRWAGAQLKPTPKPTPDDQAATKKEAAKDDDKLPPIAWTTFHSWAEVGEWYRGLALDRAALTPSLQSRADSEVAGASTPDARIEALYAYVSSHVRYIGVAFGIGRFQPHAAGEVLANQYGDCKDKHTLLAAMLRAEHLPASAVLIGQGVELNEAVPSPGAFNHLITLTSDAEHGDIWLDSTPEVAPYRMLESSLRDKLALVIPASGEPRLQRTPADLPFPAFTRFEASATLASDGTLKAHVDLTMRGDQELAFRQILQNVTPAQWDRVAQFYTRTAGFGGDPSNTAADPPGKTTAPLHFRYDYTRASYGDWANFRVIPLQPFLNLPMSDRKSAPTGDIDLGGRRLETTVSRIKLPAGYGAELPSPVHLHTDFVSLDKVYRLEASGGGDTLVTERTLAFTASKLPGAQWPVYRKFLDEIGDTEPWIQLTSTGTTGSHPPAPGETNPLAAELVRQANRATMEQKWSAATEKLDQAKAVNPRQAFLWSNYGYIAEMNGKFNEAAEDFSRELKTHPEETAVSRMLADVELHQGKTTEAIATLRAALVLDGKDELTETTLSGLLMKTDAPGAEAVLRTGLSATPDSVPLQLALSRVLLLEGKRDEAARLLVTIASTSRDPAQLNDVAYALADASIQLPVAERTSRHALGLLNAATLTGETGVGSPAALSRAALLVASWDTFGWTLYQEGNLDEAEPWLRAGWANSFGQEAGLHLATLLAKQGKGPEGAHMIRLAAAGERGAETEALSKTRQQHETTPGTKGRAGSTDPAAELQKERTFTVPRGKNVADGWAVFELELANQRPPTVRFAHGEAGLADLRSALAKVDLHPVLPPATDAHLLRRGILSCHGGASCTFVLLSPRTAALTQ